MSQDCYSTIEWCPPKNNRCFPGNETSPIYNTWLFGIMINDLEIPHAHLICGSLWMIQRDEVDKFTTQALAKHKQWKV